ncbi:MAG: HupE/UreJ family protein [Bacteroidia bacterium]|nr:HupE/UreJ family protein [Bacteroidia bacterium]
MNEFWLWFQTGLQHIADINGYDHILFLLVLCAPFGWKQKTKLVWLVSFFTIGHSISLAVAVLGWFKPHVALIEFLIPLSIFITAVQNFWAIKKENEISIQSKYAITLFFGVIHGLGFSFLLSSLLGSGTQVAFPLFSFNLGLEVGQLLIVALLLSLSQLWNIFLPAHDTTRLKLFSAIGGILSLWLMANRIPPIF